MSHLRKRKSSTTLMSVSYSQHHYQDNPFLKALKCINLIDINKSASSFAINKYNIKFLCDILQCGFNVNNKPPKQSKPPLPSLYKCW